jgi:hypothetical protein
VDALKLVPTMVGPIGWCQRTPGDAPASGAVVRMLMHAGDAPTSGAVVRMLAHAGDAPTLVR